MTAVFQTLNLESWSGGFREVNPVSLSSLEKHIDTLNQKSCSLNEWGSCGSEYKVKVLKRWANSLMNSRTSLAKLNCLETGRSYLPLVRDSIPKAARAIRYFVSSAFTRSLRKHEKTHGEYTSIVFPEKIGNMLVILPWNDPLVTLAWKLCPALLAGNKVIIKPSEFSTATIREAINLLHDSGLPEGLVFLAEGGGDVGDFLVGHEIVDAISFTGSVATARRIIARANSKRLKRVSVECGGKGFFVYSGDGSSSDIGAFSDVLVKNMFYNQGQVCSAPSVACVPQKCRKLFWHG